jgi:predicted AlkP superfamily pyrophosphatase or phosphodiesterase
MQSRRDFLTSAAAALAYSSGVKPLHALQGVSHGTSQRTVVVMFDGFGLDYLAQSDMPTLRRWQRDGLYKQVKGMVPSVTNANNSSICCGVFPKEHGITGNSYFDPRTSHEEYMETADRCWRLRSSNMRPRSVCRPLWSPARRRLFRS